MLTSASHEVELESGGAMIVEKDVAIPMRDGVGSAPYTHYHGDYNTGQNTIYTGGDKASYLLLPLIPPKKDA